ncbi:hypothetical protein PV379_00305 [Streptomyces caniscabiei]|uniref:hypothetical protein n=1 Tax=Streptomyces caniscabiei TaxID=2746961 RepID=UPI0029A36F72|nr:hypothetical protein [Streptomyces caniscabiei]MDX2775798.1 hypothetical protein [Streptomyces caniscabiei]
MDDPNQPDKLPQTQQLLPPPNAVIEPEVEPPTKPVPPSAFDTLSAPSEFQPIQLQPNKPKSRRKLWIILASILIVLVGGSAAAYQFWYQNPEKVITDGVLHALQAKTTTYTGSVGVALGDTKATLNVNGVYDTGAQNLAVDGTVVLQGMELPVKGSALIDRNSDLYVRFTDLDAAIGSLLPDLPNEAQIGVDRIIAKINGQWVKVEPTEVAAYSSMASRTQTCWANMVQQTENHASFIEEIAASYKKNKFVTVSEQLGQKEGSFGYVLSADQAVFNDFIGDIKNTEAYRTLHECDPSMNLDEQTLAAFGAGAAARTEVWVSMFSHQITNVSTKMTQRDNEVTLALNPVFNQPVSVAAPEKAVTLKDLQADIEAILTVLQQAQAAQQGAGSGQSASDDPLSP